MVLVQMWVVTAAAMHGGSRQRKTRQCLVRTVFVWLGSKTSLIGCLATCAHCLAHQGSNDDLG